MKTDPIYISILVVMGIIIYLNYKEKSEYFMF